MGIGKMGKWGSREFQFLIIQVLQALPHPESKKLSVFLMSEQNKLFMYLGCAYYPEYWPKERWETDLKLMKDLDFNVVRLAEYSWVKIEPEEGKYQFEWLDEVIELCTRYDIKVILGTPTDSMPAWLAKNYPESLALKEDGTRILWGGRKNNCYSDENFRRLSKNIASAMAKHYKYNDTVIGWQIGNEYGPPESRSKNQQIEFQNYLKKKYKTLDNLNKKWGNAFWGHTFTEWDQIPIPLYWRFNPSMSLEWKRFHTRKICEHQQIQINEIRRICPEKFITHNFIGHHTVLDYSKLATELDFVSWDNYPIEKKDSLMIKASLCGDLMRGLKNQNYWIMEQATGMISVMWENMEWEQYRNAYKDELRKIAFQQIAHGADGILWFRWRATTTGREQYLSGITGQDGEPTRRFHDIKKTGKDIKKIEPYLKNTSLKSEVAILFDYESAWANWFTPVYKQNNYFERVLLYYKTLFNYGVNVDIIQPESDLSDYSIIITPDLVMMPDEIAEKLNQYVYNGGVLFADCRTGEKDEFNRIHQRQLPGLLKESLGIEIDDITCMYDDMYYKTGKNEHFRSLSFTVHQYCEWVKPITSEIIFSYENWQMENSALLTRNEYGKGKAWYLGAIIKEDSFYELLIRNLMEEAKIPPLLENKPDGVEVSTRENTKIKLTFIINHTETIQKILIPEETECVLPSMNVSREVKLERYDIMILKQNKY